MLNLGILQATPLNVSMPLGQSPKGTATADAGTFQQGDVVTFTVNLNPQHATYPVVGYNVHDVVIYRRRVARLTSGYAYQYSYASRYT